jgi:hypothetical protein
MYDEYPVPDIPNSHGEPHEPLFPLGKEENWAYMSVNLQQDAHEDLDVPTEPDDPPFPRIDKNNHVSISYESNNFEFDIKTLPKSCLENLSLSQEMIDTI